MHGGRSSHRTISPACPATLGLAGAPCGAAWARSPLGLGPLPGPGPHRCGRQSTVALGVSTTVSYCRDVHYPHSSSSSRLLVTCPAYSHTVLTLVFPSEGRLCHRAVSGKLQCVAAGMPCLRTVADRVTKMEQLWSRTQEKAVSVVHHLRPSLQRVRGSGTASSCVCESGRCQTPFCRNHC